MTMVIIAGERRIVTEDTARVISQVLDELEEHENRSCELDLLDASVSFGDVRRAAAERDAKRSIEDWVRLIEQGATGAGPNLRDEATRRVLVGLAAIAIAALRVPVE